MPKNDFSRRSILIVSADQQFDAFVKKAAAGFLTIDLRKSAALARRCILEKDYDIVVINAPLPDETGEELALDIAEGGSSSVLIAVPRDIFEDLSERMIDRGILVLYTPMESGLLMKSVRFLTAVQGNMQKFQKKLDKMEEKMEELRIVSKAKVLLVEKKKMTEEESHRYIGKQAMDRGVSRKRVAEGILDELE